MRHLGLFDGIGGFSLAARWMGWETIAWCEINEFCQKVLSYHFPKANKHGDITKTDFTIYRGQVDILTGGFPCQPYSMAGKRLGKEDDRHLWPEMLRAIREIQPSWVVGENVRGLTNWNGGLVFDEVQADLETEGYEVLPFLLPACAVNAPHRRDRIWFVAYSKGCYAIRKGRTEDSGQSDSERFGKCLRDELGSYGYSGLTSNSKSERYKRYWRFRKTQILEGKVFSICFDERDSCNNATHTNQQRQTNGRQQFFTNEQGQYFGGDTEDNWANFPTQSPVCSRDDGVPSELGGITFSKHRKESLKGYGNAIVPQVALQIFKAIEQYNVQQQQNRR